MIILGLDPSVDRTGCAIWDVRRKEASMVASSIRAKDLAAQTGGNVLDVFTDKLTALLDEHRPSFVAIESPREDVQLFLTPNGKWVANPGSTLGVNRIYGCLRGILRSRQLPWEQVAPQTWRKEMYGFGTRSSWKPADWKREAKARCADHFRVTVQNGDEAEAVMIAAYAYRNMQKLKDMLNQMEKAA